MKKLNLFEYMILFVGILLTYFGFTTINSLYKVTGYFSWEMLITIFIWLTLLVLFILLSLGVDSSKRQLEELKLLKEVFKEHTNEIRLLKKKLKK